MSAPLPFGASALMAARAPAEVAEDDPQTALYRKLGFFPTAPWGARAGAEILQLLDPEARKLWECCCGQGHMAAPAAEYFEVFSSDVHPFGYGEVIDFLGDAEGAPECDWIFTNPAFPIAGKILTLGLRRARRGVAMLLPLRYLEGGERGARYRLLFGAEPMTRCAVFSERLPMVLGRWDPEADTATTYAWFFWMKGAAPMPLIGIPPGTRDRLWKPDDAARFGRKREAGLLDMMGEGA